MRQDESEGRFFWDLTSTVTLKKGFCGAPFASADFGAAVALTLAAQTTLAKRTMILFLRARLSARQQTA